MTQQNLKRRGSKPLHGNLPAGKPPRIQIPRPSGGRSRPDLLKPEIRALSVLQIPRWRSHRYLLNLSPGPHKNLLACTPRVVLEQKGDTAVLIWQDWNNLRVLSTARWFGKKQNIFYIRGEQIRHGIGKRGPEEFSRWDQEGAAEGRVNLWPWVKQDQGLPSMTGSRRPDCSQHTFLPKFRSIPRRWEDPQIDWNQISNFKKNGNLTMKWTSHICQIIFSFFAKE